MSAGTGWSGRRVVPPDWRKRRAAVMRRAGDQCETVDQRGSRCGNAAAQVDDIVPVAEGGGHDLENLAAICGPHHAAKTKADAARGRARWHASRTTARRGAETHPGRISRA
jgi:5-methylcytosine-specific restriction protein A